MPQTARRLGREFARTGEFEAQPAERITIGGTSMAHKTHRWHVRSLQQKFDLQHIEITWYCNVRGCHQLVTYTHTFRKPPAGFSENRPRRGSGRTGTGRLGGLEVDWRENA